MKLNIQNAILSTSMFGVLQINHFLCNARHDAVESTIQVEESLSSNMLSSYVK